MEEDIIDINAKEENTIEENAINEEIKNEAGLGRQLWERFKLLFKVPDTKEAPPAWLIFLCEAGLFLMLNQIRLPFAGGRIAISDLAFLFSFIPLLVWLIRNRHSVFYPLVGFAVLVMYCVANLSSMSGFVGAFKCAQMVQYLLCGIMIMSFLLENVPGTTVFTVILALGFNLLVAVFQAGKYGIGSALAPADVLALPWGFGKAFTGLFRSRMAFSFFTATSLAWLFPQLIGKNNSFVRTVIAIIIAVPCLLAIVHGQMLLIAICVLLIEGYIYSRCAGNAALLAIIVAFLVSVTFSQWEHRKTAMETMSMVKTGEHAGELKTNHIDFIAALKMASANPSSGVGSGRYQENIGTYYGELPNPAYNDIATDTQAAWGIIAGTAGVWTAAFMALLLIMSLGTGLGRVRFGESGRDPLALGGAGAIGVIALSMFITDPFIRGLAWLPALALASTIVPRPKEDCGDKFLLLPGYALLVCVLLGLLISVNAVFGRRDGGNADCRNDSAKSVQAEQKAGVQPKTESNVKPASPVSNVPIMKNKTFKVLNADNVSHFTPPFTQNAVAGAASSKVLEVLDNAGKPPEGKEPSMEYGGAVFQVDVPAAGAYRIYLRVWWEGSCGNTLNVLVGDEKKSITVGNDSKYNQWHWVEVPRQYQLAQGPSSIAILNREDGIKLDQILITSDLAYVPQGIEK